jgi:hypothetical protein
LRRDPASSRFDSEQKGRWTPPKIIHSSDPHGWQVIVESRDSLASWQENGGQTMGITEVMPPQQDVIHQRLVEESQDPAPLSAPLVVHDFQDVAPSMLQDLPLENDPLIHENTPSLEVLPSKESESQDQGESLEEEETAKSAKPTRQRISRRRLKAKQTGLASHEEEVIHPQKSSNEKTTTEKKSLLPPFPEGIPVKLPADLAPPSLRTNWWKRRFGV